jgi:hypothetical protein
MINQVSDNEWRINTDRTHVSGCNNNSCYVTRRVCSEAMIYGQLTAWFVTPELKYPSDDNVIGIKFLISKARHAFSYSMEQSPSWKANWFAAIQEIPCVLWNPKVPHSPHKRPPPVPILSQPNPVLTPTSHFLKIHPEIRFYSGFLEKGRNVSEVDSQIIIIIIIYIQEWTLWSFPSPQLQLLSPSFLRSSNWSLSLWSVVVWFQGDSVLWHSLQV